MTRLCLALVCALAMLSACKKPSEAPEVDTTGITIDDAGTVLRHGPIGVDRPKLPPPGPGVYAYVHVSNASADERRVVVSGEFTDAQGDVVVTPRADELRIPPGKTRPFALVYQGESPEATGARFTIGRNDIVEHPVEVEVDRIESVALQPTGDGAAHSGLRAWIENRHDQNVVATVIAAFYDKDGKLMSRPFTILELAPRSERDFVFAVPPNTARHEIFVGEVNY